MIQKLRMTSTYNPQYKPIDTWFIEYSLGKKQILVTEEESLLVQLERARYSIEYRVREGLLLVLFDQALMG